MSEIEELLFTVKMRRKVSFIVEKLINHEVYILFLRRQRNDIRGLKTDSSAMVKVTFIFEVTLIDMILQLEDKLYIRLVKINTVSHTIMALNFIT